MDSICIISQFFTGCNWKLPPALFLILRTAGAFFIIPLRLSAQFLLDVIFNNILPGLFHFFILFVLFLLTNPGLS